MERHLSTARTVSRQLQQQIDQLQSYRQNKRFKEAVETCKNLEDDSAFNSIAFLPEEIGKTFFSMGLYDDAANYLEKAVRIEPDNSNLHYGLGLAYARAGKSQIALKEFEEANRLDRNNVEILTSLGHLYFVMGDIQKAAKTSERALRIDPSYKRAKNNSAYFDAVANRKLDEALQKAKDLLSEAPDSAKYLDTKGRVHLAIGEIDQALECLEKANTLEPNNPYITENLKEVYKRKAETVGA